MTASLDERRLAELLRADDGGALPAWLVGEVVAKGHGRRRRRRAILGAALVGGVGAVVALILSVIASPAATSPSLVMHRPSTPPAATWTTTSHLLTDHPPLTGHYVTLSVDPARSAAKGIAYVDTEQNLCFGQVDVGTGASEGACGPVSSLESSGLQGPVSVGNRPIFTVAGAPQQGREREVFGVVGIASSSAPAASDATVAVTAMSSDGNDPVDQSPTAGRMGATGPVAKHLRVWSAWLPLRTGARFRVVALTRSAKPVDTERFVLGAPTVAN